MANNRRAPSAMCSALAVAYVISLVTSVSAQDQVADRSVPRIAAANALLDRYRSTHSLDDLSAAEATLFSANDFSTIRPADLNARRRAVAAGYAKIFRELELLIDPAFDPADRKNYPLFCLTPPREPNGRQAPSCADPNDVQDPGTRAAYVAALDENAARTRRIVMQRRVQILAAQMTDSFVRVLRQYRSRTSDDGVALDSILRENGMSAARRVKIEGSATVPEKRSH